MTSESESKQFEKLVAVIESQAVPRGAIVKSPDHIVDLVTGRKREVDASIRFRAGTTDILITIECRKRKRGEDVTWIEQLATKKQRIGAAKTIAVSPRGFSKTAIASAKHYGIELRKLSEIQSQDVEDWFIPHGIVHLFREIDKVRCLVKLEETSDYVEIADSMGPCFLHDLVHTPFPAAVFFNFIEMKQPKRFWSLPLDGTVTRVEFDLDATAPDLIPVPLGIAPPEKCQLRVRLGDGLFTVRDIKLSADISYKATAFESEQGKHYLYEAGNGKRIQHSRFIGEVFGLPVTFDHQSGQDGNLSATVEFPSGLRLDSTWLGIGKSSPDDTAQIFQRFPVLVGCKLCDKQVRLELHSVLPDYLFPDNAAVPKERLLCLACSQKLARWDDYGRKVLADFPENLGSSETSHLRKNDIDYSQLRLWLLSILWRISVAKDSPLYAEIGGHAENIKVLVSRGDPGLPVQYSVRCVVPRFDGRRLDFSLPPVMAEESGVRLVIATFRGILFMFSLKDIAKDDELDPYHIRPGRPWLISIIDYEKIDFLKHWIDGMIRDVKNNAGR